VIRKASMPKTGSYSTIRSFLNVYHPVFYAATMRQFVRSLRSGIRSDGNYFELRGTGLPGIPFSRNLDLLMSNPYNRPYILILDLDKLSKRYTLEETNVPDDVGGYVLLIRSGIVHPSLIRGLIVGNRMYDMRSQPITKPSGFPGPFPAKIAPRIETLL
jgi:hypothetical protein